MIDRDRLRRLALVARDDDQEPTAAMRMTTSELLLVSALDAQTVLELLDASESKPSIPPSNVSTFESGERVISLGMLWGRERELLITSSGTMHLIDEGGGVNLDDWLQNARNADVLELVAALASRAC